VNLSDAPDVMKVRDVAAVLDADVKTVYRLIHHGELEAVSLGRSLRVTRHALLEFLGISGGNDEGNPIGLRLVGGTEDG